MKPQLAALILALTATPVILVSPAGADVLIDNVNGMTIDEDGRVETFNGLLVGDNGRIEDIYRRRDKRPERVDYKLDGKGRTLIPGLIDSHVHMMQLGINLLVSSEDGEEVDRGKPRPEDRDLAFAKAQQLLLSRGVTALADMGTTIEDWQTYRRAGDLDALHIRIVSYAADIADMELIGGPGPTPWLYDDRLKLNGVSLTLDGRIVDRKARLKAPYADAPGERGTALLTEIQLRNLMSRAAIDNFQVAVNASGDEAVATALSAIEELMLTYTGNRRWRIEGAALIDPADALRIGQHGIIMSMRPEGLPQERSVFEARLGPDRLAGAQAWKLASVNGAVLAFGSGASAKAPEPIAGLASAITREDALERPFGGWQPQERLTREAALTAYTTSAAHAIIAEERLGQIAKGFRADFLILDRDPLLATARDLRAIRVLQTWVNGELVYDAEERKAEAPEIEGG